ncbi:MAG: hypothetical protein ACOX4P_01365 [Anaerovoracaceae bacterium]
MKTDTADSSFDKYEANGFQIFVEPGIVNIKEIVTLNYNKSLLFDKIMIDGI